MKCEICQKPCRRRSKVVVEEKTVLVCRHCVFKLETHEVFYCEACQKYHFNRIRPLEEIYGRRSDFGGY